MFQIARVWLVLCCGIACCMTVMLFALCACVQFYLGWLVTCFGYGVVGRSVDRACLMRFGLLWP